VWIKPTKIGCHGNVLEESKKNNFRLIIYSLSPTNPENLAKIGPVDFKTIGLTKIVKKQETAAKHKPVGCVFAAAGRGNKQKLNLAKFLHI